VRLRPRLALAAFVAIFVAHASARTAELRPTILERFLSIADPPPTQVRALRHLEARNDHFDSGAWLDVWTDVDRSGFRYTIVGEGGSEYIRSHVLVAALKSEKDLWSSGAIERATFTPENYEFELQGLQPDGLVSMSVKPRRKEPLFVEGSLFLNPEDGDLVRIEGRLVKSPSFWTRRVEIVRWFRRVAGIRLPVAVESTANVLIAGRSTFRMDYAYESVNGRRVGNPQPRLASAAAPPGPGQLR
jgi:hypothetical protein